MGNIEPLNGSNYPTWKEKVLVVLGLFENNHTLHDDKTIALDANANTDALREYYTELDN